MCKPLKSFGDLKKGDKFRVVSNSNGHNYPMDTVLTMKKNGTRCTQMNDVAVEMECGNTIQIHDIVRVSYSVEEMRKELVNLDKQKADIQKRIQFCEDNELTEFDQTEFDLFTALDIIEGKGSRQEKVRLLAKILKR